MKVVAVGSKAFVTGFALAGVQGEYVRSSNEALERVKTLLDSPDVGLIMLSNDMTKEIRTEISSIKSQRPLPLIYEVPAPGSKQATVEYRTLVRQILGV